MTETFQEIDQKTAVMDAAKMVSGMLWQDFEPMSPEFIQGLNNDAAGKKDYVTCLSGSIREFSTEDIARREYIDVIEVYSNGVYENQTVQYHILLVGLTHPDRDYLVKIDLDHGDMFVETDKTDAWFNPAKSPAITNRVIGSLAMIASELL